MDILGASRNCLEEAIRFGTSGYDCESPLRSRLCTEPAVPSYYEVSREVSFAGSVHSGLDTAFWCLRRRFVQRDSSATSTAKDLIDGVTGGQRGWDRQQ